MKKIAIASAIIASLSLVGTAHAYQAEVGGSAGFIDPDHGGSSGTYGVDGTYYFKPVQTRDAPLAEAAFLDRASNVNAHYKYSDIGNTDVHQYGIGAEYFVPNSNFYLNGEIGREDIKRSYFNDNDTTLYSAELGYFVTPNLLIAAGVKGYDNDYHDGADPTLRAKYVAQLSEGRAINLEAGAAFGDLDEFNVGADYYFDRTLSVGVDYYDNDLTTQSEFGLKARKFLTPQFSVEGRVGFGEVGSNDYNKFGIAAKYRF